MWDIERWTVTILAMVAERWWGLVTILAMISVSDGYGTDGSNTPTTVAVRVPNDPSLTTFPSTVGSLFNAVVQKRYVRTTAPAAARPSSRLSSRRPLTRRRALTLQRGRAG